MSCPYCEGVMEPRDSAVIYRGRSFGPILLCSNFPQCDARVGIRNGKPLGTPARQELRELRKLCHARFDFLWKEGAMSRSEAYQFLQKIMNLADPNETHIAKFDEERCRRFLRRIDCPICRSYPGEFGPSHEGSRACRNYELTNHGAIAAGGTLAHCTCNGCF